MAEKKILAFTAFARALNEVATEVDDDDDPQDAIKEYGKELVKSMTLIGIGEAAKIGKIAKKAWKNQKAKAKPLPQFKLWGQRRWNHGVPPASAPPGAAPNVAPPLPQAMPGYTPRLTCSFCARSGHIEATCYMAHPEMRPAMRP